MVLVSQDDHLTPGAWAACGRNSHFHPEVGVP